MKCNVYCIVSLVSLGVLFSLWGCSPATIDRFKADGKQPLTAEELQQEITSQKLILEAIDFEATVHYQAGGHLYAKSPQGEIDSGTWSITPQNQLCMKFNRWYYGDLKCYNVFKEDESFTYFTSNGARYYTGVSKGKKVSYSADTTSMNSGTTDSPSINSEQLSPLSTTEKQRFLHKLAQDCPGCNFSKASLAGARLADAQLPGSDLSDANLAGSDLRRANLSGADLSGADLTNCNLSGADLSGSNLLYTKLAGALFIGANLTGAQIDNSVNINTTEGPKALRGKNK